jgi:hypothetical protein
VLTCLDKEYNKTFMKMTQEEKANWVTAQLKGGGFPTQPMGACWGVLVEGGEENNL